MSKKNRRHKRKNNKNILGVFLIAFVVVVIISLITFYSFKTSSNNKIDKSTYCRSDGNDSITAILIDETDRLNAIQQASLRNELQKIRDEVPKNGKLEVYLVSNTKRHILHPILSICNPGRATEANKYYENPLRIERKWKEDFDKPLSKVFLSLSCVHESKESPIFESIQSISVGTFNHPDNQHAQQRRLIIASDMLQYTHEFDLYHQKYNFQQEKNSNYFRKVHSDLRNVDVDLLLFRRMNGKNIQGKQFINFWNEFFNAQNATMNRIYVITG